MRRSVIPLIVFGAAAAVYTSCERVPQENTTIAFTTISGSATYRLEHSAKDYNRDSDLIYFDSVSVVMPTDIYGRDITPLRDSILSSASFSLRVAIPCPPLCQN